MSDIFLSYKSEDRARAKILAEALVQQGYSVWWDRIILPGKTFDEVIEEALDAAKCVIVLWSRGSVLSDWVKNEAREGVRRRVLVPVLIDDVKIPFEFRHIQAASLVDWQGTLPNPEFSLLLNSVAEIVGRPPAQKEEKAAREEEEHKTQEDAERERQNKFLAQLRERKPMKVAAAKPVKVKAKAKPKKGKRMARAAKSETYYCTVCGSEILCTTSSESPIVCCDEVMYILELQ